MVVYFLWAIADSKNKELFFVRVFFRGKERHIQTKKPLSVTERLFAVRTGLEPVTPCVTGMYSNQLN